MSLSPASPGISKPRVVALFLALLVFGAALVGRAVHIQLTRDPRLEGLARRQFESRLLIRPSRGLIMDRNGEPLVINSEVRSLAANPSRVEGRRALARQLAKALGLPLSKLQEKLAKKGEFIWIKRHLEDRELEQLRRIRLLGRDGGLHPGLLLVKESRRVYPHKDLGAHLLGSVNLDGDGLEGMELWAQDALKGKIASVSAIRDALGRPTFLDTAAAKGVQDGETVALTIDASLQFSVEQELKSAVHRTGAKGGTVIVMDSQNGEILAMANEPSFTPGDPTAPAWRRRNRALTDGYEPGSTLKPVLLAGALQSGMKVTDQVFGENGSMVLQGHRISEAEAHEKFGWITLKKMIQVSSNVGAAKLALKFGADAYFNWLKTNGFGARSGLGFPGEISGKILPRKQWQPLTLANVGFGQGILVTPMQMLRAYAVFANGGYLVQPTLLKSKLPLKGVAEVAPVRILSPTAAAGVTEALLAVTSEGGTGLKANVEGYRVAGKTGTAQAVDPRTGRYSRSHYITSFIGFPTGVEPKLVILTLIDEPKGVYYASETAAPLFQSVLRSAANRFSLPTLPAEPGMPLTSLAQQSSLRAPKRVEAGKEGVSALKVEKTVQTAAAPIRSENAPVLEAVEKAGSASDSAVESGSPSSWKMPDLRGLSAREALLILQKGGFDVDVHGEGVVRTQTPAAGQVLNPGAHVSLRMEGP